jgi:hypothetical protein
LLADGLGAVGGEQAPRDPGRHPVRFERSEEGSIITCSAGRGRRVMVFYWILVP